MSRMPHQTTARRERSPRGRARKVQAMRIATSEVHDAGHGAVGVLDDRGEAGMVGEEVAVAERPVVTAACTGSCGSHERTLEYDEHHKPDDHCGILRKRRGNG